MQNAILGITTPLGQARHTRTCGGKAVTAGRLYRLGYRVPEGFCVSADAYRAHLWATGNRHLARSGSDADYSTLHDSILSSEIAPEVASAIERAYSSLGDNVLVAVRHSATDESAAGPAYATVLAVRGAAAVLEAVRKVWASLWTEYAVDLRDISPSRTEPAMAVMVQVMVDSVVSGVVTPANLETGNRGEARIRSAWGIYSEAESVDKFAVDLGSFRLTSSSITEKPDLTLLGADGLETRPAPDELIDAPSLSSADAVLLSETAVWVEKSLGFVPVVQWANDGQQTVILGAKPVTSLPGFIPPRAPAGAWQQASDDVVSFPARSLVGAFTSCWGGRVYRRLDDASARAAGARVLRQFETASAGIRKRCRPVQATDVCAEKLQKDIRTAAKDARRSVQWLERALRSSRQARQALTKLVQSLGLDEPLSARVLLGGNFARRSFEVEFQRLGAFAWQADVDPEFATAPDLVAEDSASARGYAFEAAIDALDPARWLSWFEAPSAVTKLASAIARGPIADAELTQEAALSGSASAQVELLQAAERSGGKQAARRLFAAIGLARAWDQAAWVAQETHALALSALRSRLAELGRQLHEAGSLCSPHDIFCLTLADVSSLQPKASQQELSSLRRLVARRKHQAWLEHRLDLPRSLPAGQVEQTPEPGYRRNFSGRSTSGGEFTGTARLARSLHNALALQPGEVLVAAEMGPAWVPLFGLAGAVVCACDDYLMASEAAADYGIPCVCVDSGAAEVIRTGSTVRVDGESGTVEVVKR